MPSVAAVHDTLRQIDAIAFDVLLSVDVRATNNRTAMNAHSQFNFISAAEGVSHFNSARYRSGKVMEEDESETVPGIAADHFALRSGSTELRRGFDDFLKFF